MNVQSDCYYRNKKANTFLSNSFNMKRKFASFLNKREKIILNNDGMLKKSKGNKNNATTESQFVICFGPDISLFIKLTSMVLNQTIKLTSNHNIILSVKDAFRFRIFY